jgi:uncharacterized 2Fe-2S/4Fe-4S cluster protein (DUF4445 family)
MARVVFTPSGLHTDAEPGTPVLEVARRLGVDIDSVCGGRGICGRCQITPSIGAFPKWGITSDLDSLSVPAPTETDYRGKRPLQAGNRLSCAATVCADTVIDVPASSQVHRQVVRKNIDLTDVVVDPVVTLHYLQLGPNDEGVSATELVVNGLATQHQLTAVVDRRVLPIIVGALNKERGHVTVAVSRAAAVPLVVGIWTGFVDAVYGLAVDIGSTTIAGHLCDLETGEVVASGGRMNPQIRFGEDLMSRVSYVMMNPGGEVELTRAVRNALDELAGELCSDAGVQRSDVLDCVFVGNPVMHHLLLGFDPVPLGQSPFTLATNLAVHTLATDLDIDLPFASVYVGPCIAGHVGADTTAAMLAEGPHRGGAWQLLVDVGTNAEIVLGTKDRQFAASSPTGPAFEGAQLVSGQRATAGAIERVRIDPVTLEPRFRVIGSELWSDEPGFADSVAKTGVTGICGSGIIEVIAQMYLVGICDQDGVVSAEAAARSSRLVLEGRTYTYVLWSDADDDTADDRRVVVTQNDIRQIQLAKAALRAGIDLLIEHAGSPAVSDIRLAGAFGAHIDPLHALLLGLVPDAPLDGVRSVGNAAGGGAVRALLSRSLRNELESAAAAVTKIETATEPRFQELFVAAMAFPHATATTDHLAGLVALPPRRSSGDDHGGRRTRRGRSAAATASSPLSSSSTSPPSAGQLTEEPS